MNKLLLQIGEYIIQINFKGKHRNTIESRLKKEVKDNYKNFLVLEAVDRIDFEIDIIDKKIASLNFIKENSINKIQAFVPYFEKSSMNKVTSYYYISLIQLNNILKEVVEGLLVKDGGFILYTYFEYTKKNVNVFFLGLKTKIPPLSEDCALVVRRGGGFYLYQAPFYGNRLSREGASLCFKIDKLFLIEQSVNNGKKIVKKEQYIDQFLKFSNIPSLHQHIEYKQNASRCMKNFLGFLNHYDLFSYQLPKENHKVFH